MRRPPNHEEGLPQGGITRKMRQNAQFDLGIIRGHQEIAFVGHKRPADFSTDVGADGNVLQVGVTAGQATS